MNPIKTTPMMRQYLELKEKHKDKILWFRLGDFYEMFLDDAVKASKILQLALTKRQDIPMCGIPHHASKNYLNKLVQAGCKIAIAEQVENPAEVKGIVKRKVTQVITPGTVLEPEALDQESNNFIFSFLLEEKNFCGACIDLSTGDVEVSLFKSDLSLGIKTMVERYQPKEMVFPERLKADVQASLKSDIMVNPVPDYVSAEDYAKRKVKDAYQLQSLNLFGKTPHALTLGALASLFFYLEENHQSAFAHLKIPNIQDSAHPMVMDPNTINHLDLVKNSATGGKQATLFSVLNQTKTPMGARLFKKRILSPLSDIQKIKQRHKVVSDFYEKTDLLGETRDALKNIYDFERLLSRLAANRILPKEMITLKESLIGCEALIQTAKKHHFKEVQFEHSLSNIIEAIDKCLLDEPKNDLQAGNYIDPIHDDELSKLTKVKKNGTDWILSLLEEEKKKTNIHNLKIKHTDNAGYFFEVTKANLKNVPDYFVKKQTMVNADRFVSEKLLEYQTTVLEAKSTALQLEQKIYQNLKNTIHSHLSILVQCASYCAEMDYYSSLAQTALEKNYVCPIMKEEPGLKITEGRHPVVEAMLGMNFVPNDTSLDSEHFIHILTGPNMAGKSTYLRQVAIVCLLAQIGSFVPASYAELGVCDRIFTRIGASDNLAQGESTFLVEMSETAYILSHATKHSLLIMDEIGRGTSTYDGLSLAWSIIEYLQSEEALRPRTLFATHYHELTQLEKSDGIANYHMAVNDSGKELTFLKKVASGPANDSYGIHVAEMAGIPKKVIQIASEKLAELESSEKSVNKPNKKKRPANEPSEDPIRHAIKEVDLNHISPMESMMFLESLKEKLID